MTTEIKDCPFCGSANIALGYAQQPAQWFFMRCVDCGAQGPTSPSSSPAGGGVPADIVQKWGNRAAPSVANGAADERRTSVVLTDKQCATIKAQAAKATDDWLESQPEENPQLKSDGMFIRHIAAAIATLDKPVVAMTDGEIIAEAKKHGELWGESDDSWLIAFARAILSAAGPDAALLEALTECASLESAEEIRSIARSALAAHAGQGAKA